MISASADGAWRGRSVFVTGSSGFLGGWMVRELKARGALVVGLERDVASRAQAVSPDFKVAGRLEDYDVLLRAINEYEIETVMHLGAQPIVGTALRNPMSTFEANIRGTWNLLEACRQVSTVKRIVLASSDKAYGSVEKLPYEETTPLSGRHPYDVSKSCADMIGQTYHETYGLPVCITRSANFYGGGDLNFNRIVPGTIRAVMEGKRPVLRSDGTMVRDYIYVRDVVAAYIALADAMDDSEIWGQAYNFSVEAPASVLEITRQILDVMGRRDLEPVILNEAKAEIQEQYLSAAKARRELGWRHQFTLEQGLAETIAWYADHLSV